MFMQRTDMKLRIFFYSRVSYQRVITYEYALSRAWEYSCFVLLRRGYITENLSRARAITSMPSSRFGDKRYFVMRKKFYASTWFTEKKKVIKYVPGGLFSWLSKR